MTAHISQAGAGRDPAIDEHEESAEMTPNNTDEQIRHVFDEWHRAVKDQDAEGMAALYAHDGVLKTPAVLALWPEREDAVVHSSRSGPPRRNTPSLLPRGYRVRSPASGRAWKAARDG